MVCVQFIINNSIDFAEFDPTQRNYSHTTPNIVRKEGQVGVLIWLLKKYQFTSSQQP